MSGKNQLPVVFNWQTTSPVTNLLPLKYQYGTLPSGTLAGTMTGTSTIYTQIIDISKMDNLGLEITYTGTPTGVVSVMCSNSGLNFYAVTFSPALTQPSGSAGGYLVNMNQVSYKYMFIQYVNTSGTGSITAYGQMKDLN